MARTPLDQQPHHGTDTGWQDLELARAVGRWGLEQALQQVHGQRRTTFAVSRCGALLKAPSPQHAGPNASLHGVALQVVGA
jgi:hypothetical protein